MDTLKIPSDIYLLSDQKLLIPYVDSIEFLVLAHLISHQEVTFVIFRNDRDNEKYKRWNRSVQLIDEAFREKGGKAKFVYENLTRKVEDLMDECPSCDGADPTDEVMTLKIINMLQLAISKRLNSVLVVPYGICDYYLSKSLYEGQIAPLSNVNKHSIYQLASFLKIPEDLIHEYQVMDTEKLEDQSILFKEIEWAHAELQKDSWAANLTKVYTDRERECLQWTWRRRNENK